MQQTIPAAVYILCFLTSSACAWLLGRSYLRSKARLLLWASACFLLLALAAICILLFGFIWDLEEE